ncbi:MAG: hypothetical protein HY270_08340 [Deltaproteobacteria bacterium]|nr:hypothetical protein [Deltaproteobacteria bacterium]
MSLLGAALLAEAIEAGAIEETAISIAGIVEHESHRYLQIRLETGIVYNEVEVPTDEQGRRLWKVVETCLRRFKSFSVPEEGLAFHLAYKHLSADPPVNFYQAIRDNRASLDVMEMFLPKNSLEQMLAGQQTPQAVLAASVALVNGRPIQIKLEP